MSMTGLVVAGLSVSGLVAWWRKWTGRRLTPQASQRAVSGHDHSIRVPERLVRGFEEPVYQLMLLSEHGGSGRLRRPLSLNVERPLSGVDLVRPYDRCRCTSSIGDPGGYFRLGSCSTARSPYLTGRSARDCRHSSSSVCNVSLIRRSDSFGGTSPDGHQRVLATSRFSVPHSPALSRGARPQGSQRSSIRKRRPGVCGVSFGAMERARCIDGTGTRSPSIPHEHARAAAA